MAMALFGSGSGSAFGAELISSAPASQSAQAPIWLDSNALLQKIDAAMASPPAQDVSFACRIAPGLTHYWSARVTPPVLVNIFEAAMKDSNLIEVQITKAGPTLFSRDALDNMAQALKQQGEKVLAGVNGGYWDTQSRPVGSLAGNGRIYTAATHQWTLLRGDHSYFLGNVEVARSVKIGSSIIEIDSYNAASPKSGSCLYLPEFGNETPTVPKSTLAVRLKVPDSPRRMNEPIACEVIDNTSGPGPFALTANQGWLLLLSPVPVDFTEEIQPGTSAIISFFTRSIKSPIDLAISAGPMLLADGEIALAKSSGETSSLSGSAPRPRTGLGISREGNRLFLVTMEGETAGRNTGATLEQLAMELRRAGAWQAMNLDGGTSTCAWAYGRQISRPAPLLGSRPVNNGLFFVISSGSNPMLRQE